MQRIDKAIAGAEDMLIYLASDETMPVEIREGLVEIVESVLQARNKLKLLMLRGL